MLLTLEPLPAAAGDCLLLHWGSRDDPKLAIIDGGPGNIYETSLRPRLDAIHANRQLDHLDVDLVLVSHVDSDHIMGVKKLFRKLKAEIQANLPASERPVRVARLWHNTFNDILGDTMDQYYRSLTASYQANIGSELNPALVDALAQTAQANGLVEDHALGRALDSALILAAHSDGRDLRDSQQFLLKENQIAQLNAPFTKNGKPTLIMAETPVAKASIAGLLFTIIGPLREDVEALQKEFDAYIKKKGLTAEALLSAYTDESVPNLSSIVCLVELKDKRILLTGDARGDKILQGLKMAGELKDGECIVDVLKVPHHGSSRNVEADFFKSVIADTYVFSGNGKYGNPERETLEWLIDARGKKATYQIVLTYSVKEIDSERKRESERRHRSWKKASHSLEALFQNHRDGYHFSVTTLANAKLDLGDQKVTW